MTHPARAWDGRYWDALDVFTCGNRIPQATHEGGEMPIRKMTSEEIRRALRRGAQVCCDDERKDWGATDVLPQDGAFDAARGFTHALSTRDVRPVANPEHAATFLLLVAEAHE